MSNKIPSALPVEIHDFKKSQELERQYSPIINTILKRVFPFVSEIIQIDNMEEQKRGVDKKVLCLFFESGKQVTVEIIIDEKIRPFYDYGDFLIEEWSDEEKRKPGWMNRKMITDYIVVYWVETGRFAVIPFLILQAAYFHNYKEWQKKYPRLRAYNQGWTTTSFGIPMDILFEAMKKEMNGESEIE